ncbi:MAG TPA: sodium-dependent transporter [Nevskiaceae bacterium]|nr:sodium-dependent transporter [Nevskiaceae bacterium]
MSGLRESAYGYWTSPRAFLWVAAGCALGIGSLVRLPALMASYGGSAFLLVYLLALLTLGLPLLLGEWLLGRWMREDLVSGFQRLGLPSRTEQRWRLLGRMFLIAAALVLSYYSVIAGWSLGYAFRAAAGALQGETDPLRSTERFLRLAQDPERSLSWHTLFMVAVTIVVSHGFKEGIEKTARLLLPVAGLMALLLLLLALQGPGAAPALAQLVEPDFSRLGWRGVLEALQAAFFTLGLGLGAMLALGSYLPASMPLVRYGFAVLLIDTGLSLVVGFAVLSLTLPAGLEGVDSLTALFQLLPTVLPPGLRGQLFATVLYLLIFVVTLLAAAALLEPLTRFLMERQRTSRVFAATTGAVLIWALGIGSLLSFSLLSGLTLLGQTFFGWLQLLTALVLAPLGGLGLGLLLTRVVSREALAAAWGPGEEAWRPAWYGALRYPARLGLIAVVLHACGLFDAVVLLWS